MKNRLDQLNKLHEQIHEVLLGINWEERYKILELEKQVKEEIRKITGSRNAVGRIGYSENLRVYSKEV